MAIFKMKASSHKNEIALGNQIWLLYQEIAEWNQAATDLILNLRKKPLSLSEVMGFRR